MPVESTKIYCRDARGVERYWYYEVAGAQWRGHAGIHEQGAADVASGWSTAKAKNIGKKNARTAEEQASFEAEAEFRKKLDRQYRRTPEELNDVPPSPMLAQNIDDLKKPLRFHPGGYIRVQPKLDGIRMNFSSRWRDLSRDYQPFGPSISHLRETLGPIVDYHQNVIFDGELYNHTFHDDFNELSSLIRTKRLMADDEERCRQFIQYHVYDCILTDQPNATFSQRQDVLHEIYDRHDLFLSSVALVPTHVCDTWTEVDERYDEFLADGYEGEMIRCNEAYERDVRSWFLLKRKQFTDIEVEIVRLIDGEGNWAEIPKSLEYIYLDDKRCADGSRPRATIKGSMDFCRKLRERPVTHATIRFFALTPDGVPRFPRAIDFHEGERRD